MGKIKKRFVLSGDKSLADKLNALTDNEAKKAIQDACKEALKPVQKLARTLAPKRTGRLQQAIRIRTLKRSRKRVGARVTLSASDPKFDGVSFYGAAHEFDGKGNRKQGLLSRFASRVVAFLSKKTEARKNRRFMKRAFDQRKDVVLAIYGASVRKMIQKVIAKRKPK